MNILERLKRNILLVDIICVIVIAYFGYRLFWIFLIMRKYHFQAPMGLTVVSMLCIGIAIYNIAMGCYNYKRAIKELEGLSPTEQEKYEEEFRLHNRIGHFYCGQETFMYYRRNKIRFFRYDEVSDLELHKTTQSINFIPIFYYYKLNITSSKTKKKTSLGVRRIYVKRDYERLLDRVNSQSKMIRKRKLDASLILKG